MRRFFAAVDYLPIFANMVKGAATTQTTHKHAPIGGTHPYLNISICGITWAYYILYPRLWAIWTT